jgi:hypothetical protein
VGDVSVYVISAGESAVKVGLATRPDERLRALQTAHYQRLSLFSSIVCTGAAEAIEVEQRAHRLLKDKHLHGEWFDVLPLEAKEVVERALSEVRSGHFTITSSRVETIGPKKRRVEKPWFEKVRFSPLEDRDFDAIQALVKHARDSGGLSDECGEWTISKSALTSVIPAFASQDYEDTFWLRLFNFWFDYKNIKLRPRGAIPGCFPKSRIFSDVDFYTDAQKVEFSLSYAAAWIVEDHGVEEFMRVISTQSDGYKQKETAA